MSTEFISIQPPPGASIEQYNRSVGAHEQAEEVPAHFCDAMSIREEVFVHEQNVPLENELDEDDARSWHWVTYVSVGSSNAAPESKERSGRKGSTASRLAAATIRLVPPPHAPHPTPGTSNTIDARVGSSEHQPHSKHNPEDEPYIKLGRLCSLQPFRKLGMGRLLVETAMEWAANHADEILPPPSATDREAAHNELMDDGEWAKEYERHKWRGLVLVHAQKSVVEFWKKRGFVLDEEMGTWDEEGIEHVAMWQRVPVHKEKR